MNAVTDALTIAIFTAMYTQEERVALGKAGMKLRGAFALGRKESFIFWDPQPGLPRFPENAPDVLQWAIDDLDDWTPEAGVTMAVLPKDFEWPF